MSIESQFKNMSLTQFLEWIDLNHATWLIKCLSGNDTGITGGHQAGIYVPKSFMESIAPSVVDTSILNPTAEFQCYLASHDCLKTGIKAKYYNNKYFQINGKPGTRNEFRITCWANTPLYDEDNTGAIMLLAFKSNESSILGWIAKNLEEEDLIEEWIGRKIEPGQLYCSNAKLPKLALPSKWISEFPTGREIFEFVERSIPQNTWHGTVDTLLLKRRNFEFKVFSAIEALHVMPEISKLDNIDTFIRLANTVLNRRKSRAGASLEYQLESIFQYAKLKFETQVVTEQKKKPDFVFPSAQAYHDPLYSKSKLCMLASKTCCKDRWRQVITEADRINPKHLFTLQEGVSSNQLEEMYAHQIVLVVPENNLRHFPKEFHDKIMNLSGFINHVRITQCE